MLFDIFNSGFGNFDPQAFLIEFLVHLPAFVLALSVHEVAHAFVAYLCGDSTAKDRGRLTLNPFRHLDPTGFLMLMLVGIGYAKPVPINPDNFSHPRRDDFFVSIAGITANLLMFLMGCAIMFGMVVTCIGHIPAESWEYVPSIRDTFVYVPALDSYLNVQSMLLYVSAMGPYLIEPFMGQAAYYLYEIVVNFTVINLVLAAFNLLPVPPLDGYHVVNDLLFKRSLFAPVQATRVGQVLLLVLMMTGWLSKGLNFVIGYALDYMGQAMYWLYATFFIL